MEQLIAHLFGDYILQSDWMAQNKTKRAWPALVHALTYSALFLMLGAKPTAFVVIVITHFFIDRYRLARYVVWAKNWIGPAKSNSPWCYCEKTGYRENVPNWMAVWLLIIADNTLHLTINYLALRFL